MATPPPLPPCDAVTGVRLGDLQPELLGRVAAFLAVPDLASLNATARLFHAAPPGGCSPVERALRERARARGHERALPATLPAGVCSWADELFARECVLELAHAHSPPVAAGHGFSAFVDAEGGLHTCGEEEVLNARGWAYRACAAAGHPGLHVACTPTRVASLSGVRVVAVAAGDHLLALSDAGAVYGCGKNRFGQLGLGDTEERCTFAPVDALRADAVIGIAAGIRHSLALSAAGCAYSWGDNRSGQLGHGDKKERREPTRIEALDGVRVGGLAGGECHTLLLSAHGAVYSCGHGRHGQLGHGDQEDQLTPTRAEALAGVRAVHVSAGIRHSLVVGSDGGLRASGLRLADQRIYAFVRIEALAGVRAVRACAGSGSSAVVGADGSVHTFGDNSNGVLGHEVGTGEHVETVDAPTRVLALASARVRSVACALQHSLFVSADGSVHSCGLQSAALGRGMSMAAAEHPVPAHGIGRVEPLPRVAGVPGA